jgi:hypothetical protein
MSGSGEDVHLRVESETQWGSAKPTPLRLTYVGELSAVVLGGETFVMKITVFWGVRLLNLVSKY